MDRGGIVVAGIGLLAMMVAAIGDYPASDPIWYAQIANRLAHAPDALHGISSHPFEMRVGLTVPLAVLYRLLGVSPLVTTLPSILAALGALVIAVTAQRTPRGRWIAIAFTLTSLSLVQTGSVLGADLPCGTLIAASVLGLERRADPRGRWWLVGAALAWFAAFLVKETAVWVAPVWLYAFAVDLRCTGRRALHDYVPAAATLLLVAVAYLWLCSVVWGSPWARFTGIQALHHTWSMEEAANHAWLERLTWAPPVFFAKILGLVVVPAVVGWWVRGSQRIWVVACAVTIACFWFGSASASTYSPLPLTPRMLGVVTPIVIVAAALAIDDLYTRARVSLGVRRYGLALVVGIVVVPGSLRVARYIMRPRRVRRDLDRPGQRPCAPDGGRLWRPAVSGARQLLCRLRPTLDAAHPVRAGVRQLAVGR